MTHTANLVDPAVFPAAGKSAYLNSASVALMPNGAESAMDAWQKDLAENGTINFDEVAEDRVFDDLRARFAGLIGARPSDIAVASCATELIASIAWAVMPGRGTNIVTTDVVFPSTAYPWARVARTTGAEMRFVPSENGVVDEARLLDAIDRGTAVVSVCHVEYATGQRYDLARLAERAHRFGAFLLVDASQSLGALPLSVARSGVDAVVTTSYKWLCGPFGVGLLYLTPEWQTRLDPGITGWRTNAEIYDLRADRCVLRDDARRFEFATMAYGCAVGLARSIEVIDRIGVDRIAGHDLALANRLVEGLINLGAQVVSPRGLGAESQIVSARFGARNPGSVVAHLRGAGVTVSARRDLVRFSPHLYTRSEDIDRTIEALGAFRRDG